MNAKEKLKYKATEVTVLIQKSSTLRTARWSRTCFAENAFFFSSWMKGKKGNVHRAFCLYCSLKYQPE